MISCLFGTKPLSRLYLACYWLDPCKHSVNFKLKLNHMASWKCVALLLTTQCVKKEVCGYCIIWTDLGKFSHWIFHLLLWPVNSPHKGQWSGALMFPLICAWINVWGNNHESGDFRPHRAHYDVIVVKFTTAWLCYITLCKYINFVPRNCLSHI